MNDAQQIERLIESGARLATLETNDTDKVVAILRRYSQSTGKAVYHWAPRNGMYRLGLEHITIPNTQRLIEVLRSVASGTHYGIYLLCGVTPTVLAPPHVELLHSVAVGRPQRQIILAGQNVALPPTLLSVATHVRHMRRAS